MVFPSTEYNSRNAASVYDTVTFYIDEVRRGAEKAGVPSWSPGRIRKLVATDLEERFGLETARAMLGHTKPDTTKRHYARGDLLIASRAAKIAG